MTYNTQLSIITHLRNKSLPSGFSVSAEYPSHSINNVSVSTFYLSPQESEFGNIHTHRFIVQFDIISNSLDKARIALDDIIEHFIISPTIICDAFNAEGTQIDSNIGSIYFNEPGSEEHILDERGITKISVRYITILQGA